MRLDTALVYLKVLELWLRCLNTQLRVQNKVLAGRGGHPIFYFLIWAQGGVLQINKIYVYQDTILQLKCETKLGNFTTRDLPVKRWECPAIREETSNPSKRNKTIKSH